MRARESQLASELFGDDLQKVLPVIRPGGSDSATFDNVLELLVLAGPLVAARDDDDDPGGVRGPRRPAGRAARLLRVPPVPDGGVGRPGGDRVHRRPGDRRDARPQRAAARPLVRDPATAGSCSRPRPASSTRPPENVVRKGRLQPGKLFLVDVEQGRIVPDEEMKHAVATRRPYAEWDEREDRAPGGPAARRRRARRRRAAAPPAARVRLHAGRHEGDPRAARAERRGARRLDGERPRRSRCSPTGAPLLYSYFKQLFAQVTNPPIDPIREAVVMSVEASVGSERNLLDETPEHARQLVIDNPILLDGELERCARSTPTCSGRTRSTRPGRSPKAPTGWSGRSSASARKPTSRSPAARTSSCSPTAPSARSARRSRRCSPSRPRTTISSARERACRPGSSSSPASRAACTASPCSSATARRR